ncbi:MAG: hypothetical protein AUK55_07135 [Syntrophobacteraceae bacterium CG2_30_61_12]|nr:MAG: hypothetical protein AUK55_07135 [Syntrophobacteraceae bacterium CG2_30_61_12]
MSLWNRFFHGRPQAADESPDKSPTVGQGIGYLYLIILLQVVFVFGLMAVIITLGKILATPWWMFVLAFAIGCSGCVYIYRKAKAQFGRLRATLQRTDFSDRNYEISIMGGMLTMKVEQNPRRLLENKPANVIEAESLETPAVR